MAVVDVVIIGGGISGLHTAYKLSEGGISFKLLEARDRFGGRIHSPSRSGLGSFDIGPSWFWPGQVGVENLLQELGMRDKVFEQFYQGDALFEPSSGQIIRGISGISMQGSYRLSGGLKGVVDAMVAALEPTDLILNAQVSSLTLNENKVEVKTLNGAVYRASKVVLALPPRVALSAISFVPELDEDRRSSLRGTATWMAGHAKAVIIYDNAFWRESGLSGDVISQRGPLSEIHDATLREEGCFALFGFSGQAPSERNSAPQSVKRDIVNQLVRLFGYPASEPVEILYKDWAQDAFTASVLDQQILAHHPVNDWSHRVETKFDRRLIWSGSESDASSYNGYIEGAIQASLHSLSLLGFD